jgi:hypothetical protein
VKRSFDYYEKGHTLAGYFRSMSVTYNSGSSYILKVPVKEIYVDIYGDPIPDKKNTVTLVSNGSDYINTVPDFSRDWVPMGYKWDTKPDNSGLDFTPGDPPVMVPKLYASPHPPETIYFVYKPRPTHVDVTVSKTVVGIYADMTRSFDFTITFADEKGTYYDPGTIVEYDGGVLILKEEGKADFSLKNGLAITFKNIPVDDMIQIEEDQADGYTTMYWDSVKSAEINSFKTVFEAAGISDRLFAFTNTEMDIVPTGIDMGVPAAESLLLILILIALGVYSAIEINARGRNKSIKNQSELEKEKSV